SGKVSTFYDVSVDRTMDIYETDVLYVYKFATGLDNGLSWQDAFTDLNDALEFAANSHIKEIWVQSATYTPHNSDRSVSFVMHSGVAVYGGFNGTETERSQRDPVLNPVVLSGEIGGPGALDNSYHVVRVPSGVQQAVLDGFLVTGGQADGASMPDQRGAGIYCLGQLTCTDIQVTSCYAADAGAAIFANGWRAQVDLKDVLMENNTSPVNAGVASASLATIQITGNNEVKE
ncbi:MAG: hypothetical protein R3330_06905, partial [Saprospiraceae bacterium]|nr:hypothetical protein [Saprospiraceae bacterium]